MGCRSFLPAWRNEVGELVESGRMNLGVVTLNLPRIALESEENKEEFWNIFKERLEICKDALDYRANVVRSKTTKCSYTLYAWCFW